MEIKKLFCIRKVTDPRYTDVSFEVNDSVGILDNGVIIEVNDIDVTILGSGYTKEDKILLHKKYFFQELQYMTYFNIEAYFVPLAEYRQKRIEDVLND